jgi:hypothetical protein
MSTSARFTTQTGVYDTIALQMKPLSMKRMNALWRERYPRRAEELDRITAILERRRKDRAARRATLAAKVPKLAQLLNDYANI